MKLNKETLTDQINEAFHKQYPKLKLAFYRRPHKAFAGSKEEYRIHENVKLAELNKDIKPAILKFQDDIRVKDLEALFEEKFGLHVQVFRKSGEQWLQTSITDNWTLGKQEERGEDQDKYNLAL